MRLASIAISIKLSLATLAVYAQADSVTLKVTIKDSYTLRPLSSVSVINPRSGTTNTTNGSGFFQQRINKRDTLFLFSPGYQTVKFTVSDSAYSEEYTLNFVLEPLTSGLSQGVIIRAPRTLEQIEKDRQSLGKTPRELDKPKVDIISSPIGALWELLSARAHEREKLKKQMVEDDRRRVFKELLRYYNENGLIDLPEAYYEEFTDFCNFPIEYLKYNTDYVISKDVVTLYNKYGRMNGLIK